MPDSADREPRDGAVDNEAAPPTQPPGSLVPPGRGPWRRPGWRSRGTVAGAVADLLDVVDHFADEVAARIGLR
jgi:hypothetical protein